MPIDLAGIIDSYGYAAVFVGAFLEGETVLALAGLAARRGYLDFLTVCVVATIAGFAGDQLYFFLGRYHGGRILARFPSVQARAHRLDAMLARWHAPLIVAIRFMYGFRIAGPILLGMGRVPAAKFLVFNLLGAVIWAPLVAAIGYAFGALVEVALSDWQLGELALLAAVALAVALGVLVHRRRASGRPPG
ncbi:MAG TPA: DedA family protein [Usitatibacter sp.]|nr:DedA family protein [Usitatibacter sp.]